MSHYYTKQGDAMHYVPMKTNPNRTRPTRVSDAKELGLLPSVTTILDSLAKPAIVNWKVDKAFDTAFQYSPEDFDNLNEYKFYVKGRLEEELNKAPEAGTDVHQSLENYFLGEEYPEEHQKIIDNVLAVLPENQVWVPEERTVHQNGFAGTCDLHSDEWVIDFKTKQFKEKFKKGRMAYPDHSRQLAAYRESFGIPKAKCANIFICIETGEVDFHVHKEEDLRKGWKVFQHALAIWQINNYDASF